MSSTTELDEIKKEIKGEEGVKIEEVNVLFLDISSSCTGYAIARVNFTNKTANFKKSGCLWLNPDWSHQEKYSYMFNAIINFFWIVEAVDYIVVEQYSVNPKKMMGINVVSEMQGAIKTAAWENGVKVSSILPQTWRAALGIKKIKDSKGNSDYKEPTKQYVLQHVQVPEMVKSNITNNDRQTPSDLYDAIAVGMGWLTKLGFKAITFNNMEINPHIGAVIK